VEYYIYNIPVFIVNEPEEGVDIPVFCQEVEEILPHTLLGNVDAVYVGDFKDLRDRNAAYSHGAIYMTAKEPTNFDMLENFIHETAHSLEQQFGWQIYDDAFIQEFKGKRRRLYHLLNSAGFPTNEILFGQTEYNKKFDEYLAHEVGYPTLVSLTMGLFTSPYGATSIEEYFANGFEKYFLDDPLVVQKISPILYEKIESILNEQT